MRYLILLLAVSFSLARAGEGEPAPDPPYLFGPEDQIIVKVMDLDDIPDRPVRVDPSGYINLPLVGRLHVAGLSAAQLEAEISSRVNKYVKTPEVSVNLTEFRSQPVSIIGAVNTPGVHQLQGPKRLIEMLSLAGGTRPDSGSKIRITRQMQWGKLPLPDARVDVTGQYSVAELNLDELLQAKNPPQNIYVRPQDVISIPTADVVYVIGEVKKAGGFTLHNRENLSLLQALALAEGLEKSAAPRRAKILRASENNTKRVEIPVNLRGILDGQSPDMTLQPNDVLFIPNNIPRNVAIRSAEAALQIGTGIVIWRR
jgi:polysaccharide biosynthesis/export protein